MNKDSVHQEKRCNHCSAPTGISCTNPLPLHCLHNIRLNFTIKQPTVVTEVTKDSFKDITNLE